MPTKLKISVKTYSRQTGKTTIEHFYLHATKLSQLEEIANDENLPIPPLPPSARTLIFYLSQLGFLFSKNAAMPSLASGPSKVFAICFCRKGNASSNAKESCFS